MTFNFFVYSNMSEKCDSFCFCLFSKTKYVAGIAFQLVDDWLDFVSTAEQLGRLLQRCILKGAQA